MILHINNQVTDQRHEIHFEESDLLELYIHADEHKQKVYIRGYLIKIGLSFIYDNGKRILYKILNLFVDV